jgi:hypothetical protein
MRTYCDYNLLGPQQRFHCHIEVTQTKESYQGDLVTSTSR